MGNSKYLDSLSQDEKRTLAEKLWEIQNHKCYICGDEIDLKAQPYDIDHIVPLANKGLDGETNFAIEHSHCNRSKKDADCNVARVLAKFDKIATQAEKNNDSVKLKHVLEEYGGSKFCFSYNINGDELTYSFDDIGDTTLYKTKIDADPKSNEKTIFIRLPIEYLYHDDIINPRGINSSISLLVKEFYKGNPQLQISLARIDSTDKKIKVFDGQHKAAAQILLGARDILLRVFVETDMQRLIDTNLRAGKELKQIAFGKDIVKQLHSTLYAEKIKKYREDYKLSDDDYSFSEQNLVDYFKGDKMKILIVNNQKDAITKAQDNKLTSYINFEGRGNELPLSYSTFEKTVLAKFINKGTILSTSIDYKTDVGENPRMLEKEQLVQLCNIFADEVLINKYDSEIGTYKIEDKIIKKNDQDITDDHLSAYRICKEEIMYNLVDYIEFVITNYFATTGNAFDKENLFQQKFPDKLWENIRNFIVHYKNLPLWKDKSMANTIFSGKQNKDYWKNIFNTGNTIDGRPVLAKPINYVDMIQADPTK